MLHTNSEGGRRIGAFVLDMFILSFLFAPLGALLSSIGYGHNADLNRALSAPYLDAFSGYVSGAFIFWVALVLYDVLFHCSKFSATPGKIILGLKVVNRHGEALGIQHSVYRALMKYASYVTMGISFCMMFFSERQFTLQDMVSHSYVVPRDVKFKRKNAGGMPLSGFHQTSGQNDLSSLSAFGVAEFLLKGRGGASAQILEVIKRVEQVAQQAQSNGASTSAQASVGMPDVEIEIQSYGRVRDQQRGAEYRAKQRQELKEKAARERLENRLEERKRHPDLKHRPERQRAERHDMARQRPPTQYDLVRAERKQQHEASKTHNATAHRSFDRANMSSVPAINHADFDVSDRFNRPAKSNISHPLTRDHSNMTKSMRKERGISEKC